MDASCLMISIKKSHGLELAELLFPLLVGHSNLCLNKCVHFGWEMPRSVTKSISQGVNFGFEQDSDVVGVDQ